MNISWLCCIRDLGGILCIKIKEWLQAMIFLHDSASKLVGEMGKLRSYKKDKEDAVRTEEKKNYRLKRTDVVDGWLRRVDELGEKVAKFDSYLNGPGGEASSSRSGANAYQTGDRGGCSCCLCSALGHWGGRVCVLVKLSYEVADLIGEVRELKKEGEEIRELVKEAEGNMESFDIEMVVGEGAREALTNIHKYLDDDTVGIIGIYGMGGVGKSSLLKTIRHEYIHVRPLEFPRVIWAEVIPIVDMDKLLEDPHKIVVDIERLRNSIGKDLPGSSVGWSAESLKEALRGGRFLLLLENVWERVDLDQIGIPTPDPYNRCKIVFTTRSDAVRHDMNAAGVKLGRLTEEEALQLFGRQLNNDHLLASCKDNAKIIVKECHGLPLALKVMARVMRSKNFKSDWLDTIEELQDPRTMFSDRIVGEEDVFKILRYSYYHLKEHLRPCLLYCALIDNSTSIDREEIIDYWIGEGFFDRDDAPPDIKPARKKGRDVINDLLSACLLERSSNEDGNVTMHGLIHDMAIKIAAQEFLVYPDSMTKGEQKGEKWELAKRISLAGSGVTRLPTKGCPKLVTLLLKNCDGLTTIPENFFNGMSALCVLDLSNTLVEELPQGIINLKQLRHLNLSYTKIKSLPVEVRALDKLNQLNLSFTRDLKEIPYKAISGHDELRTLNLFKSKYRSWVWNASDPARGVSLSDLEALEKLQELSLNIIEHGALMDLLDNTVSQTTVCLYLEGFPGISPETRFDALEELRELYIANVMELEKLVFKLRWLLNLKVLSLSSLSVADVSLSVEERSATIIRRLSRVEISKCNNLVDLSWVRHLGCIDTLSVRRCGKLRAIIVANGGHGGDQLCFNSLRSITLAGLPELERFSECRIEMSSMPSITVDDCPKLTGEFVYYDKDGKQNVISYRACEKPVTKV